VVGFLKSYIRVYFFNTKEVRKGKFYDWESGVSSGVVYFFLRKDIKLLAFGKYADSERSEESLYLKS
jgi:hypothetical protein